MRMRNYATGLLAVLFSACVFPAGANAQNHSVDASRSTIKIHVSKSGLFSAFGHSHEVEAPIESGTVELSPGQSVQLRFDARKLRVLDPDQKASERAEVQETMLGAKVLDSTRFPEVSFKSTIVEKAGADHWTVQGNLTLHGQTHHVVVDVTQKNGHYLGSAAFKQTAFGIEPVSAGGGSVKVKDELKITFDVVLK